MVTAFPNQEFFDKKRKKVPDHDAATSLGLGYDRPFTIPIEAP